MKFSIGAHGLKEEPTTIEIALCKDEHPHSNSDCVITALRQAGIRFGELLADNADFFFLQGMLEPLKVEWPELF